MNIRILFVRHYLQKTPYFASVREVLQVRKLSDILII